MALSGVDFTLILNPCFLKDGVGRVEYAGSNPTRNGSLEAGHGADKIYMVLQKTVGGEDKCAI